MGQRGPSITNQRAEQRVTRTAASGADTTAIFHNIVTLVTKIRPPTSFLICEGAIPPAFTVGDDAVGRMDNTAAAVRIIASYDKDAAANPGRVAADGAVGKIEAAAVDDTTTRVGRVTADGAVSHISISAQTVA